MRTSEQDVNLEDIINWTYARFTESIGGNPDFCQKDTIATNQRNPLIRIIRDSDKSLTPRGHKKAKMQKMSKWVKQEGNISYRRLWYPKKNASVSMPMRFLLLEN